MPLVRTAKTLPRILSLGKVDALVAALRTDRDQAMVQAMVLGGLRRCEVLGLDLGDVRVGERRVFIAEGNGGRQRLIPMSARFFEALGRYLDRERPAQVATSRVFVVLKGARHGQPLSAYGLDEVLEGARAVGASGMRAAMSCAIRALITSFKSGGCQSKRSLPCSGTARPT